MVSISIATTRPRSGGRPLRLGSAEPEALMDGGPIGHKSFSSPDAERRLFGPDALDVTVPPWTQFPESGDGRDLPAVRRVALSGEEEAVLFLKYNYARHRLRGLVVRKRNSAGRAPSGRIELWHLRMMDSKEKLARANMALVIAMARRTRIPNVEFSELISEGNMALLRSIEKFDVSRGFKFSTYACRSILKAFNRLATKTGRYRRLFPTENDPDLERSDGDAHRQEIERRDSLEELREAVLGDRAGLSRLERRVLVERFAVGGAADRVRTLAEVGKVVGLTCERVRQVQKAAMVKLRAAMADGD